MVILMSVLLCFNLPTKWQILIRMKYVLCSVRQGNTNNMMKKFLSVNEIKNTTSII